MLHYYHVNSAPPNCGCGAPCREAICSLTFLSLWKPHAGFRQRASRI